MLLTPADSGTSFESFNDDSTLIDSEADTIVNAMDILDDEGMWIDLLEDGQTQSILEDNREYAIHADNLRSSARQRYHRNKKNEEIYWNNNREILRKRYLDSLI